MDEVLSSMISLATQSTEGVHFNSSWYLCYEFLANSREVQDEKKPFPLCVVGALHCAGHMGSTGGQPVSYIEGRIAKGRTVHLPLGHQGPRAGHINEDFLGIDGSELPHGHQPMSNLSPTLYKKKFHHVYIGAWKDLQ